MDILNHLNIPSPVTLVKTNWSEKAGVKLYLKRDDLIHPIISGNKWRKLSGVFNHYAQNNYTAITTYGGAYSNHLVATAAVCAVLQIPCAGIIRGESPKIWNPVLKMCRLYGMNLKFVSRDTYKEINRTEGVIEETLHIPEGGASKLGTVGCQEILKEVNLAHTDRVYVSCGTGTTISGMSQFLKKLNVATRLHGIQVLKGEGYIAKEIEKDYGVTDVIMHDDHHCGGYAKSTEQLMDFIKEFSKETGVLLDPIYTGKMMLAIKKHCENGSIKNGENILAIHTGGLTGWFGKASEL